jgi:hypothetical protein
MTPTVSETIDQARKWPRDGFGEGYWFHAMADQLEAARAILEPLKDCDPAIRQWLGEAHIT